MGCIGSRVALFRSCSFTSGSHSGSLTSSSGGVGNLNREGVAVGGAAGTDPATRRLSRRENFFSVQNVDDTGQGVSPGKLEVTENDIVLHVKGKLPLTWPLKSLRRYGFDNDLFSFESGRRCHTGAGIFAFRCHRAQSLFNLLQAKIHEGGGERTQSIGGIPLVGTAAGGTAASTTLPTLPSTPLTPTNAATPLGTGPLSSTVTTPVGSTFVYVNISENTSTRVISTSGAPPIPPPSSSSSTIVTTGGTSSSAVTVTATNPDVVQTAGASNATLAVSSSTSTSSSSRGPLLVSSIKPSLENHPVYMNVDSHGGALYAASTSTSTVNYSNIPPPTAPRRISTCSEKSQTIRHTRLPSQVITVGPSPSSSCSLLASSSSSSQQKPLDCALYSNVLCNHKKGTTSVLTGAPTSSGGIVVPLSVEQEPAELNYAELDLKPDRPSSSSSSQNSPYSSARLGLYNKHHQLVSTYARTAEPYNTSRLTSISDDTLGGDSSVHPSSRLLASGGLPGAASASGSSTDQNNGELGYATIDFDKTAQLNVITRSKIALGFDDGDSKKGGSSLAKKIRYGTTGL